MKSLTGKQTLQILAAWTALVIAVHVFTHWEDFKDGLLQGYAHQQSAGR